MKRLTDSLNELINDKGVCRISPAIPGLLTIKAYSESSDFLNLWGKFQTSLFTLYVAKDANCYVNYSLKEEEKCKKVDLVKTPLSLHCCVKV